MRYRAEIDGLRALSVMGVVIFHAGFSWQGHRILSGGYLGVDVFLVISGYLITRILLSDLARDEFSVWNFYMRRVRRILPALYVVLASSSLAAYFLLPIESLLDFAKSGFASIFFYSNLYFWYSQDYFSEAAELSPLLHMWSLSVEEQFYLFYPLILFVIYRRARSNAALYIIIIAAISFMSSLYFQGLKPAAVFHLVNFRAWELLSGALIAFAHHSRIGPFHGKWLHWLGCGFVVAAFLFGSPTGRIGQLFMLLSVVGACLVIVGEDAERPRYGLAAQPLVAVGLISYSLYLWHQPVFALFRHYSLNALSAPTKISLIIITMLLAWATWWLVERPFRNRKVVSDRDVLWSWGAGTGVLVLIFGLMILFQGLPWRYTVDQQAMLAVVAQRGTLALEGQDCSTASLERVCRIGASGVAPTWALLGDSHAETLSDALSDYLVQHKLSAEVLTYPACPFVLGVEPVRTTEPCLSFTAEVLKRVREKGIKTVVINDRVTAYMLGSRFDNHEGGIEPGEPFPIRVAGQETPDEAGRVAGVKKALFTTIRTLIDDGVRVVYIAPVPEVGWYVPHAVVKLMARGGLPLTTSRDVYLKRHAETFDVLRAFENESNFLAVYPSEVFCSDSDGRCRTHTANRLLYTDTDHLSREGAALLVEHMAKRLQDRKVLEVDHSTGTRR